MLISKSHRPYCKLELKSKKSRNFNNAKNVCLGFQILKNFFLQLKPNLKAGCIAFQYRYWLYNEQMFSPKP